ncbi:MAG TPA: hypothetical protein VEA60_11475, partial [Allosphingosinicella sp.]|nr:hypothetical protein [Allosphingosinicella sp.]
SAMFQVLAAVVAHSYGVGSIHQYENGVLGLAIPQSGNFIPTRHAHPETHRRMAKLLAAVLGSAFTIANPFLELTKRQVGARLAAAIGEARADALLRRTESCWYLAQPRVAGLAKGNGQPCGACAPCLVRLTARPGELDDFKWSNDSAARPGYAFDMRRDEYREKEKLGLTFRAYLELIEIVTSAPDDSSLIDSLAPEARVVVDNRLGPDEVLVAGVLRRFASEFCDTFGIRVAGRS